MAGAGEESNGIESLKNFERALGHVRNSVRPLTLMSREEVGACVSPANRAKLNLQVAYGVSSLFYMFLRTQGVSPLNHPVKAELDRIREYFGRLKRVGKPPEQRTLKVDAEASRRFINNALSGDNVWKNANKNGDSGIGRNNPAGQPENPQETARKPREAFAKATPGSKRKHAAAASGASETTRATGTREAEGELHKNAGSQAERRGVDSAGPRAKKANTGGKKTGKKSPKRIHKWA